MSFPTRAQLKIKRALARQATRRRQMLHIVPQDFRQEHKLKIKFLKISRNILWHLWHLWHVALSENPMFSLKNPENLSCRICTRARENSRNLENLWKCLVTSVTFVTKIHFHENLWTFPVTSRTVVTENDLESQYQICLCFVRDPRSVSLPS